MRTRHPGIIGMMDGAPGKVLVFVPFFLFFFCSCYQSSGRVVHDVSLDETAEEILAVVDEEEEILPEMREELDSIPDDPEMPIDGAVDSRPACPEGLSDCGELCVNQALDPENCGGCDTICPRRPHAHPVCADGECGIECVPGFCNPDGIELNGCESCDFGHPEECNGMDDDMDGAIDEDFECMAEDTLRCTTSCAEDGLQTCSPVDCTWGLCCSGEELCGNGCDDDCDGLVDETCP